MGIGVFGGFAPMKVEENGDKTAGVTERVNLDNIVMFKQCINETYTINGEETSLLDQFKYEDMDQTTPERVVHHTFTVNIQ